jgi:hypothetical protein
MMTDFQRATVAAFLARREHGEYSPEYRLALEEMERQRPGPHREPAPPSPRCNWCGQVNGHRPGCHRAPGEGAKP